MAGECTPAAEVFNPGVWWWAGPIHERGGKHGGSKVLPFPASSSQIRSPKPEIRRACGRLDLFGFRVSDFLRISDFGFRQILTDFRAPLPFVLHELALGRGRNSQVRPGRDAFHRVPLLRSYFLTTSRPAASFAPPVGPVGSGAGLVAGVLRKKASAAPIRSMIAEMVNALW